MTDGPKRSTFRRRYEEMLVTLRNEIITGISAEGSFLPSENDIAERFQLSKNSVRKGLELLVDEGFIEKIPRVGNRIQKSPMGVTIKFGYYPSLIEEADLKALVGEFHKQHPLIRVNIIPMPSSHLKPTMKDFMESDDIDVMAINNQNFELFAESDEAPDLLEPLQPVEGVYPVLTEPFMRDGSLYVQPFLFSPIILCYNKQHFSEKSIPEPDSSWTWDTVKKVANQLSDGTKHHGLFFHFLSDNRWPIFLLQNNIRFNRHNDCDKKLELDETALQESLQVSMELLDEVFPPFRSEKDDDAEMLFCGQKVSMILTSYFCLNKIKDVDFAYDISPLPYLGTPKTLVIAIGLAIHRNSKNKQAAQTFINFIMSYETQLKIRQNTLSIPSLKSAAEWDEQGNVKLPSRYFVYREIFPSFSYHTALNVTYSELGDIRQRVKLYLSRMEGLDVFS
ncbi:extracellular solute-binding protein [Paenibacillus sp. D2_2]|uniref:extracellular solute-binding protein n=1 Tax=Paenibacillus sp. D2_2 TaxID=3073092 RepID=UPI002814F00F|nr:extracellular solute-binding protein [Paenibacillus sp. D2_2]WMT41814.1 extracellular solute-binding protein [Paenibacillus sp. D2_2]